MDGNDGNDTLTTTIYSCNTLSGIYTINKNALASATNYQSFTTAAQALANCGISGPVTFNVVTGTGPYNEQVVLSQINGASATNTITFNGNGNTITTTTGTTNQGLITLDGTAYVKFDNFVLTVDAAATTGAGVQLFNDANYNTISNNIINLPFASTSSTVNGIFSGSTVTTGGSTTTGSKFQNNTINGGYYSIRLHGNTGAIGAVNNEITSNILKEWGVPEQH